MYRVDLVDDRPDIFMCGIPTAGTQTEYDVLAFPTTCEAGEEGHVPYDKWVKQ
jgi:hypothetical protein